ncbi:MAG: hypothetical protein ACTSQ8_15580 [Candidatus Helarchaeota archaeon]
MACGIVLVALWISIYPGLPFRQYSILLNLRRYFGGRLSAHLLQVISQIPLILDQLDLK